MSKKHPIVAITGSSGAGTSTVKTAFEHLFWRLKINAAVIEGDSYHAFDRKEMAEKIKNGDGDRRALSHFGPRANLFAELENTFKTYSKTGKGKIRKYLHNEEEAEPYKQAPGTFTKWENMPANTDLLFYEGLHGGVIDKEQKVNVAQWVDLLVGVVPIVNLEWIQKIHRDCAERGYSAEAVTHTILRRMRDYVGYITPQFSQTHINFQRVPTVDTSNPFIARDIPTPDESFIIIRFRNPKGVDFPYLLNMLHDSFMSRPNSIVVPGGKMTFAMELVFGPILEEMIASKKKAK